jgi:hypothetical protein
MVLLELPFVVRLQQQGADQSDDGVFNWQPGALSDQTKR